MRAVLMLIAALLLVGCGGDEKQGASQPTVTSTGTPTATPAVIVQVTRAATGTPERTMTPMLATAIPVPPYQLLMIEQTSLPIRPRYRANVVMSPDYGREQVIAVLADAARRMLRERSDAKAVVVFGYSSANTNGPFTKGRAWASSDGRGWTGDGSFDTGPDGNNIHITVGASGFGEPVQVKR